MQLRKQHKNRYCAGNYDGRKGSVNISILVEMFADPFCMHYNERRHCAVPSTKSTTVHEKYNRFIDILYE